MKKFLFLIIPLSVLFSCDTGGFKYAESENLLKSNQAPEPKFANSSPSTRKEAVVQSKPNGKALIAQNRKMIWTASLEFEVENVEEASEKISEVVRGHKGFVSQVKMRNSEYKRANNIQIRVKNDRLLALVEDLKAHSIRIDNVDISSRDVTEEFVDIESRLRTKKEARQRYVDILRNKTGDIKDVIEAEEAIRRITEEIEAKEGRLRYLNNKIEFSTVDVSIYQTIDVEPKTSAYKASFGKKVSSAFLKGWHFLLSFALGLVRIWPLLLIFIALFFWKRKFIKRAFASK